MSTNGSAATTTSLKLQPYIFFWGRCQEALEYYKSVFGGTYEMTTVANGPMAEQAPPDWQDKVMHASFTSGDLTFLCADGRSPARAVDPDAGNIDLCLTVGSAADGERVCKTLADGGSVTMPFEKAFWGGYFGMLTDKFGIGWMVTAEPET
jgi:PhnB protein